MTDPDRDVPTREPACETSAAPAGISAADTLSADAGPRRDQLDARRAAPQRGRWVFDQIDEIRGARRRGRPVRVPAGRATSTCPPPGGCAGSCVEERFDLVHAHYGLAGWCAQLAGAQPLMVSFHGTDVRHRLVGPLSRRLAWRAELVAAVSRALFSTEKDRPGLPTSRARRCSPAGPTSTAFTRSRAERARGELGLDPEGRYVLFPANPARAREARRSRRGAGRRRPVPSSSPAAPSSPTGCRSGSTPPTRSSSPPTTRASGWSASRPSPAMSRSSPPRSGSRRSRSEGIAGSPLRPVRAGAWLERLAPHLDADDPRVDGAARAASLSAARMAERTIVAYRDS